MRIVNLTGQPVEFYVDGATVVIYPEGPAPYVHSELVGIDDASVLGLTVPVFKRVYSHVTGLPDPEDGILYLVHHMVADACVGRRNDLVVKAAGKYISGRAAGFSGVEVPALLEENEEFDIYTGPEYAAEGY